MKHKQKARYPSWVICHRKPGTELRFINGRYYLYEYKTVYDKERKGPRKITGKLLGSIVREEGFVPSEKYELRKKAQSPTLRNIHVREYGFALYIEKHLYPFVERIKKFFPEYWAYIIGITYCRLTYRSPIKNVPWRLAGSYIADLMQDGIPTDKGVSQILRWLGSKRDDLVKYMKSFIKENEYVLTDVTHMFSKSQHIILSRKGYNSDLVYEPQFNLLYLYALQSKMPVFYRLLPGNIRDVKALKNALMESSMDKAIIVADKGFYSKKNIALMEDAKLNFIIPLRRNNKMIDYRCIGSNGIKGGSHFFKFEKRFIWFKEQKTINKLRVLLYLDDHLRVKEEHDYLQRISTHPEGYSLENFHQKKYQLGTVAFVSNLATAKPEELFQIYKSRVFIETMFDGMKNVLQADHTYMQHEGALEGWMFINHLALQWYQTIYLLLKEKKLLAKYSVNDFIQLLTEIRQVKINHTWVPAEVTAATEKLLTKVGLNLI